MKVIICGFGDIGKLLFRELIQRGVEVAGVLDIDERKVGRKISDILSGHDDEIYPDLEVINARDLTKEDLKAIGADVTVHVSGTFLDTFFEQFVTFLEAGTHVITSAETMIYPWYRYREMAKELDERAKKLGLVILQAGVNPGFIFDALPVLLTYPTSYLESVSINRWINAYNRRRSFKRKYGLGLSRSEFMRGVEEGWLTGHVGYEESVLALAEALEWSLDEVSSQQSPIYYGDEVVGLIGEAHGKHNGVTRISLKLVASDVEDKDEILINGKPSYRWVALGGVQGDLATVSALANAIKLVGELEPGIAKLKDLVKLRYR